MCRVDHRCRVYALRPSVRVERLNSEDEDAASLQAPVSATDEIRAEGNLHRDTATLERCDKRED